LKFVKKSPPRVQKIPLPAKIPEIALSVRKSRHGEAVAEFTGEKNKKSRRNLKNRRKIDFPIRFEGKTGVGIIISAEISITINSLFPY